MLTFWGACCLQISNPDGAQMRMWLVWMSCHLINQHHNIIHENSEGEQTSSHPPPTHSSYHYLLLWEALSWSPMRWGECLLYKPTRKSDLQLDCTFSVAIWVGIRVLRIGYIVVANKFLNIQFSPAVKVSEGPNGFGSRLCSVNVLIIARRFCLMSSSFCLFSASALALSAAISTLVCCFLLWGVAGTLVWVLFDCCGERFVSFFFFGAVFVFFVGVPVQHWFEFYSTIVEKGSCLSSSLVLSLSSLWGVPIQSQQKWCYQPHVGIWDCW